MYTQPWPVWLQHVRLGHSLPMQATPTPANARAEPHAAGVARVHTSALVSQHAPRKQMLEGVQLLEENQLSPVLWQFVR
jgi:hypothetical protein